MQLGERLLYLLAPPDEEPVKEPIFSMGTVVTISIYDQKEKDCNPVLKRAFDEFRNIETLMSTFTEESDVSGSK